MKKQLMLQWELARSEARRIALGRKAGNFARDEDGGMLYFGLVIILLMLFVGGMAIDLMRYEHDRSRIQAVADASVLAAASMRQDLDPEAVVVDWFEKAGLADALKNVEVDDGLNYRIVRAHTRTVTTPYFMHLLGVDELASNAAGRATERRTNVEISLVLDISGSMNIGDRAPNLVFAAREFIDRILREDTENRVSINIVPYNGQVMLGNDLWPRFNKSHTHNLPNAASPRQCLDLPTQAYTTLPLPLTGTYSQWAYADPFQWAYSESGYSQTPNFYSHPQVVDDNNTWCNGRLQNRIRPFQNHRTSLMNAISELHFQGATSIDLGLLWGASLLDPQWRPLVSQLVSANQVPAHFEGRPFDYDDDENLKVIVLMTDGEHFPMEQVNDAYKGTNLSPVYRWWDAQAVWQNNAWHGRWRYGVHHPSHSGSNKYWVPHLNNGAGQWVSSPAAMNNAATQMNWRDLFATTRMKWVAWQLYARPFATSNAHREQLFRDQMDIFRTRTLPAAMDARMLQLCTQIKAQNVVIFGIAFEASQGGIDVLQQCSSPNRFYDVEGLDIATAFRAIRAQISALRLTQ